MRRGSLVILCLFALSVLVRLPNITGYLDLDSVDYVRAARKEGGRLSRICSTPIGRTLG